MKAFNRILVVMPNWFGETLFATPFLHVLKQHYPEAELTVMGWLQCAEVLSGNPDVDQFLPYEENGKHATVPGKLLFIRELKSRRLDVAFVLRPSLSRSLILLLATIPVRVGFDQLKSSWCLTHRARLPAPSMHKAWTYFMLLEQLGIQAQHLPYRYTVRQEERQAAERLLAASSLDGKPFIVLHPGANWEHKRWPADRFAQLGDALSDLTKVRIVITGSPADQELARSIQGQMKAQATVLAGQTTLRQLAACLEKTILLVSNDTGVTHVAAALNRPLVALYGPTDPSFTGPLGLAAHTRVLHHPDCCPRIPCYQPDDPPHAGMKSLSMDEVYKAACQLLGGN